MPSTRSTTNRDQLTQRAQEVRGAHLRTAAMMPARERLLVDQHRSAVTASGAKQLIRSTEHLDIKDPSREERLRHDFT